MPRVCKPTKILELSGVLTHDPSIKRARAKEPKPTVPVGDPPKHLAADEKLIWHEVIFNAPAGVLMSSDRMLLEVLCRLFAQFRRRESMTGPEWSRMASCLSLLGFSPADRSRIIASDATPENPFAEFTQ